MSGVPRELAEHYFNINPGAKPVKQAMRRFGDKKRRAIGMELAKLLEAGFVIEVILTDWVANLVFVPKNNSEILKMCIDYSGLNKHCPKDPFPLPRTPCLALTKSLTRRRGRNFCVFLMHISVIIKFG